MVLGVVCSCSSHSAPDPLLRPPTVSLVAPHSLFAGQAATWICSWDEGTGPFTVQWDFGGGTFKPGIMSADNSPTSIFIEMNIAEGGATAYTATVTVTDSNGLVGSDTVTYEINSPMEPLLNASVSSSTDNTLEIEASGGTAPFTVRVSEPQGLVAEATEVTTDDGTATFSFNPVDPILGGGGLCFITVEDSLGFTHMTDTHIGIDAIQLNDDTLYAIPMRNEVKVDKPVTILVATGQTIHSFQFMLSVGLTVDGDANWDWSLDSGALGGDPNIADGIWIPITGEYNLFIGQGQWEPNFPSPDPDNSLGDRIRFDFNLSPLGGNDVPSVKGSMFSTGFSFPQPGLKRIGFQEFNGVNRTYYASLADSEDRFWSVLMADEMGNLHPSVVGQVDNTILVTE